MSVNENDRFRLHQKLEAVLGADNASTMMELFPPRDWSDYARRNDIDNARTEMRVEFIAVRSEMATEFAAVRSEMATEFAAVRREMTTEFAAVRSEMTTEFAAVRNEMTAEFAAVRRDISAEVGGLRVTVVLATVATALSSWALLLAALALR